MKKVFVLLFFSCFLLILSCKHEVEPPVASPGTTTGGGTTGGGTTGGGTGGGSGTGTGGGSGIPCDPNKIYFEQQVLPILLSNCAMSGCHDDASHQDGVILTSYAKVMSTADVRPGRPGDSDLYEVLIETDPSDRMPRPPRNPLSSAQITLIRNWIQQGAQDLSCQNACDTSVFTYAAVIKPIITNNCQGCHSGTAASGGIDLSSYAGLKAKITDGRLWGAINHSTGFSPMPKNGPKLPDCDLINIRKWIEAGSQNN